jgi:hypothetical protein
MGARTSAMAANSMRMMDSLSRTIDQNKQIRQQRSILDNVTKALANPEATPDDIIKAAVPQTKQSFSLGNLFRNLSGGGAAPTELEMSVVGSQLQQALAQKASGLSPAEYKKAQRIDAGLDPRAGTVSNKTSVKAVEDEQKKLDKAVADLNDEKTPAGRRKRALQTASTSSALVPLDSSVDVGWAQRMEDAGIKREVIDRDGFNDKAYGQKAYDEGLKLAVEMAPHEGVTKESAMDNFTAWWDAEVAKESGQKYVKFQDRNDFAVSDVRAAHKQYDKDVAIQSASDSLQGQPDLTKVRTMTQEEQLQAVPDLTTEQLDFLIQGKTPKKEKGRDLVIE